MKRASRALQAICLIGLFTALLLAGSVLVAERRALRSVTTGSTTPLSGEAVWEGNWEFSELGADPSEAGSQDGTDRLTLSFSGTGLALRVRRGDYRGNLYVRVDGEPANRLPCDDQGAYLGLASPDGSSQVVALSVADGLEDGDHVAVITANRGWDQWPLVGWDVIRAPDTRGYRWALAGSAALGLVSLAGLIGRQWGVWKGRTAPGAPPAVHALPPAVPGARAAFFLPALLGAALLFYFSPWLPVTLAGGAALAVLILLRLDLGLALVAATAPFFLHPRPIFGKVFSMGEIATLLCAASWGLRVLAGCWHGRRQARGRVFRSLVSNLNALDVAVLCFVAVAVASLFVAEYRHVALRELRVLILEPALFYLMLRASRLDGRATWRIVDLFVMGAVVVALIGLVQYALGVNVITAEGNLHRLRSVYGSPNSVGLYLGRVLPVVLSVALFGRLRGRRVAYGLAAIPLGLAVLLSFSKGALILGVPLSLVALGVLAGGPWLWAALGAVGAGIVAAVPLLRTPRFASLLDASSGTTFFRLQLWRAAWAMFCDHPWLGVGPDNFLPLYRSRYILPAAWQEPDLSQAHNILLDYATRMGIAGLAAGAWLQVAFWPLALRLRRLTDPDQRALALGLMASMVDFLAHGLVDASYFLIDLALAFFLTLGVVQWLSKEHCR